MFTNTKGFQKGFSVCSSPVSLLKTKEKGIIIRFQNNDEAIVKKMMTMGLNTGQEITLEQRFPSFMIKIGQTRLAIDPEIANSIYVRVTK